LNRKKNGTIRLIFVVSPLVISKATAGWPVFHRSQPLTLEGVSGHERNM